jgi:hypothetical protein
LFGVSSNPFDFCFVVRKSHRWSRTSSHQLQMP